jgi:hypothetical protein
MKPKRTPVIVGEKNNNKDGLCNSPEKITRKSSLGLSV